jgi:hypothetical protein
MYIYLISYMMKSSPVAFAILYCNRPTTLDSKLSRNNPSHTPVNPPPEKQVFHKKIVIYIREEERRKDTSAQKSASTSIHV